MEADLQRWYGIDYRDRWRRDEHGRSLLTLRRLWVLVDNLPETAATVKALNDGEPIWTRGEVLLADIWSAWTGKEHPGIVEARKKGKRGRVRSAAWLEKVRKAKAKIRDRKRKIDAGEIT